MVTQLVVKSELQAQWPLPWGDRVCFHSKESVAFKEWVTTLYLFPLPVLWDSVLFHHHPSFPLDCNCFLITELPLPPAKSHHELFLLVTRFPKHVWNSCICRPWLKLLPLPGMPYVRSGKLLHLGPARMLGYCILMGTVGRKPMQGSMSHRTRNINA